MTTSLQQISSHFPQPNTKDQKKTLEALGLRKIGHIVEHKKTPSIEGMIAKVSHLITVIE